MEGLASLGLQLWGERTSTGSARQVLYEKADRADREEGMSEGCSCRLHLSASAMIQRGLGCHCQALGKKGQMRNPACRKDHRGTPPSLPASKPSSLQPIPSVSGSVVLRGGKSIRTRGPRLCLHPPEAPRPVAFVSPTPPFRCHQLLGLDRGPGSGSAADLNVLPCVLITRDLGATQRPARNPTQQFSELSTMGRCIFCI